MQFDVGHANGGHLTGGIGQAPPGTIGVIVGLLAVDNGDEAGSGFLGADDTGGGQCIAELFAVCGVKSQDGAFAVGAVTVKVTAMAAVASSAVETAADSAGAASETTSEETASEEAEDAEAPQPASRPAARIRLRTRAESFFIGCYLSKIVIVHNLCSSHYTKCQEKMQVRCRGRCGCP